jgi:hypothetical protein
VLFADCSSWHGTGSWHGPPCAGRGSVGP